MTCGYGVEESEIGSEKCTGCHFIMKDGTCVWTPKDGVDEISGPTTNISPIFSASQ